MTPYAPSSPRPGFWAALDHMQQTALRSAARPRLFPVKAPLVYQGDESDHVIIIERGWAKVTSATEDGHNVVLAVRGPGLWVAPAYHAQLRVKTLAKSRQVGAARGAADPVPGLLHGGGPGKGTPRHGRVGGS